MEITDNLLAAYAEGNVSEEERMAVREYLAENPDQLETVLLMMDKDYDLGYDLPVPDSGSFDSLLSGMLEEVTADVPNSPTADFLPMMEMAAQNAIDNQCVIQCEGEALRHLGFDVGDDELTALSLKEGWLKPEGIALHNIGRLCSLKGLSVSHRYGCKLKDVEAAILAGNMVIAIVDGNELTGDMETEREKDAETGASPNHAVLVLSVTQDGVTIKDPASPRQTDTYATERFMDAWAVSSHYMTVVNNSGEYVPHPIDLSDVEISDELLELREAIAEQAHEVWALTRKKEGWTYGPVRDDAKKENPDMVAYNRLPESEKQYDREMALNTIKLVQKLGWDLVKRK